MTRGARVRLGLALALLIAVPLVPGALASGSGIGLARIPVESLLVLLMLALTLYAGAVVLPAAHAAREAARAATGDPAAAMSFARLHRLSSILNVIVMLSGILVVVIETVRRR